MSNDFVCSGVILNDKMIEQHGIVNPFVTKDRFSNGKAVPSWGVQSFGYDMRLDPKQFAIFKNNGSISLIDPMSFDDDHIVDIVDFKFDSNGLRYWVLPSNTTALGSTIEHFNIPDNVIGVVLGKSTYSRCGLAKNNTNHIIWNIKMFNSRT